MLVASLTLRYAPIVAGHACVQLVKRFQHSLEVLKKDVKALALLSVVTDNDAAAADDLSGVALAVDLAETSPTENKRESQDTCTWPPK